MEEYIRKTPLLETAKKLQGNDFAAPLIVDAIEQAPTFELVRCEECEYFINDSNYCQRHNKFYCEWDNTIKSRNHFCGYAKPKEQSIK